MLDASLVIFEVISTNPRAPSVERQKALIRQDGTEPQERIDVPDQVEELPVALKRGEGDVVAIAHPKVFGSPASTRAALIAISRSEAMLKLPGDDPFPVNTDEERDAFLALMAATPWGKGTRKQRRNPGRPPKRKQPNDQQLATYRRMWFGDRTLNPPRTILALASEELGRDVEYWELKHWFGASRDPAKNPERS